MTKTLTKQWQEGELKEGYYYTLLDTETKMIEINHCQDYGCFQDYCDNIIDEVLAPVPSFDEYQKLQKQLEIATKALKKIIRDYEMNGIGYLCVTRAKAALKGMEGVK